jgi:enoyl-CoA hydratase
MPWEDLLVASEGPIDVVRLNRPAVLNALRAQTFRELESVLDAFAGDPQKRVLIITGAGDRAFSAGGDIKEMRQMTGREATAFARLAHRVLAKIESTPKPVLAAINGLALGAGCDLAIVCDVGVASERAVFGEPPAAIGLVTPFGGTQRLPRIIGPKRAKYLFFTGETLDAHQALQIGLVNRVVAHTDLVEEALNVARTICTRAPIAVGFSKILVNASLSRLLDDGDALEVKLYAKCFDTADQKEGMQAFLEKRKPVFKGE